MTSKDNNIFASIAILKAKQEKIEDLRKELLGMIEPTRKEEGCIEYILFENPEAPGDFYMREAFKDKNAFETHIATPHFQALAKKVDDLLREPMALIRVKRVSS